MKTVVVLGRSFLSTRTASSTASFVPNRKSYWDRMYEHAKQQQETSSRNNNSGGSAKGDKTNAAKKGAVEEEEENDGSSYNESALRRMASIMFPAPMANTNMNSLTSSSSAIPATRFDKKSLAANVALRRSSNLGQEQQQSLMPTNATMLTRDFIHDSLYNPAYGYFTQRVEILGPPEPIQFSKIPDVYNLMNHLGNLYAEADANTSASTTSEERNTDFRADSGKKSSSSSSSTATSTSATSPDQIIEARQMWHTPTELFQVRMISKYMGKANSLL